MERAMRKIGQSFNQVRPKQVKCYVMKGLCSKRPDGVFPRVTDSVQSSGDQ